MVIFMKIAIVGGGPTWDLAPFDDPEWEIWVLGNQLDRYINHGKRYDIVFELHDNLSEHVAEYPKWLADRADTLIHGGKFPIQDFGITFDYDRARELIGVDYFTSSPACMMAEAIMRMEDYDEEDYSRDEIAIYGIDMSVDDHEYFLQRPVMEGWIGFAKGRGIKVSIPGDSSLHKYTYVEGRDWNNKPRSSVFSQSSFEKMAGKHDKAKEATLHQIQELQQKVAAHDGARQAYDRLAKVARGKDSGMQITDLEEGLNLV